MLRRACRNFAKLMDASDLRTLRESEQTFMVEHRGSCYPCAQKEVHTAQAMNMLRSCALDAEPSPGFDDRILRLVRIQRIKASFAYWSPAFIGAGVATVVLLAAIQMMLQSSDLPRLKNLSGPLAPEATRVRADGSDIPDIIIPNVLKHQ